MTTTNKGIPLFGDRSAWNMVFPTLHASDIDTAVYLRHLDAPSVAGNIMVDTGIAWVSVAASAYVPFAPTARGDMIVADVIPVWGRLALGGIAGSIVTRDATDVLWSTFALTGTPGTTYNLNAAGGAPGGIDTYVQYNIGGVFGGDTNFAWDYNTQRLTLTYAGSGNSIAFQGGGITGNTAIVPDTAGGGFIISGGNGLGTGAGGVFYAAAGNGGDNGDGGYDYFAAGNGGALGGNGGPIDFFAGNASTDANGGNISFHLGAKAGIGVNGLFRIQDGSSGAYINLDTSIVAGVSTFTFPNVSGTFALGAGTLTSATTNDVTVVAHTHEITGAPALLGNGTAQYQTIITGANPYIPVYSGFLLDGTTGGKTVFAVTNAKTLTLTCVDNFNLTIPATGTAALLGTANAFTLTNTFASQIGIGTTDIEAWSANYRAIESYQSSIMFGVTVNLTAWMSNAYYDGAWKYKAANPAAYIYLYNGTIYHRTAASGLADAAITWIDALTIGVTGGVHVGGTSDPGNDNLLVDGSVGIRTTPDASSQLHVYHATVGKVIIQGEGNPWTAGLALWSGGSESASITSYGATGEIRHSAAANYYQTFYAHNTLKMTLGTNGNLALVNLIGTYNSVATEGYGVPAIVDDVALVTQGADIGSTNFTNAGTAGTYRISYYILTKTIDAAAGDVYLKFAWTDAYGVRALTEGFIGLAATSYKQGKVIVQLASGSVSYSTQMIGNYGTGKYNLYMTCERLS